VITTITENIRIATTDTVDGIQNGGKSKVVPLLVRLISLPKKQLVRIHKVDVEGTGLINILITDVPNQSRDGVIDY
jgi:hypothetical protein